MDVVPGIGQPRAGVLGLQPQVTNNGRFAHWMHDVILVPTITVISVFVLILIFIVVFRFRAKANPTPSKTSHNTVLEVAWTLIPVLILVLIAVPSIGLLQAQYKPAPSGAVTLKATGQPVVLDVRISRLRQRPDHRQHAEGKGRGHRG